MKLRNLTEWGKLTLTEGGICYGKAGIQAEDYR